MKKQKTLILEIPKPCTESWAEMTPMGLGRFCSHCQKTVTDITQMSDTQVVQLFQKNTDTHCIRAFASQLNRPINLPAQEPTRFYRIAVALGLTLVMAAGADAYARPRPPLVEQNYLLNEGDTTKKEKVGADTLAISGVVLDETNNPFPGVIVKVMQGGLMKAGTITEDDGSFEIKPMRRTLTLFETYKLEFETYELEISSVGYEKKLLTISREQILNGESLKLNLKMDLDKTQVNEIRVYKGVYINRTPQPKKPVKYNEFDDNGRPMPQLLHLYYDPNEKPKKEIQKENNKTYNEKDLKNFGL